MSNLEWCVNIHHNQLIQNNSIELNYYALLPRKFVEPKERLKKFIIKNFKQYFRGKNLIELYVHFLSSPSRKSKYSKQNLMEIGVKIASSQYLERIIFLIQQQLGYISLNKIYTRQ